MSYVLIVDDEPGVRAFLECLLVRAQYPTRVAASAEYAMDLVRLEAPAVAVCDVHMPGVNGLRLADQIRDESPATAVILATGDGRIPAYESLKSGVIAYLLKPLDRDEFLSAVEAGLLWSVQQAGRARRSGRALPPATEGAKQPVRVAR